MNVWSAVFLGIIAAATLAMAIVQISVLLAAGRLARRIERFIDEVEREIKPIFGHLNAMARDASRAAGLAAAQVERADQLFASLAQRVEQTLANIQDLVVNPLREGKALMIGFRAVMAAIRAFQGRQSRRRAEDDEALFI